MSKDVSILKQENQKYFQALDRELKYIIDSESEECSPNAYSLLKDASDGMRKYQQDQEDYVNQNYMFEVKDYDHHTRIKVPGPIDHLYEGGFLAQELRATYDLLEDTDLAIKNSQKLIDDYYDGCTPMRTDIGV